MPNGSAVVCGQVQAHEFCANARSIFNVGYFACGARAVEIEGTVRSVAQETATIAIKSELFPNVGDLVEIYFKMAGADEEISVGSGKVTAVRPDSVEAKIEKATGAVARDQLVRISSANPQSKPAQSTATSTSTSSSSDASSRQLIVGR